MLPIALKGDRVWDVMVIRLQIETTGGAAARLNIDVFVVIFVVLDPKIGVSAASLKLTRL